MKQNKSSRSTVLLFLLGVALIVAALIMLVPDLLNYKQSNDTYEALKENYISEKAENTEVAEETEGDDSWWYTDVDVSAHCVYFGCHVRAVKVQRYGKSIGCRR